MRGNHSFHFVNVEQKQPCQSHESGRYCLIVKLFSLILLTSACRELFTTAL